MSIRTGVSGRTAGSATESAARNTTTRTRSSRKQNAKREDSEKQSPSIYLLCIRLCIQDETDLRVVLVKYEKPNEAFQLEQSTWRIEGYTHDRSTILKAIKKLSSKIAERYPNIVNNVKREIMCILSVYAPNGDHESTPKLAIQDLDHDAIANWTLKLMTQSGRKYELQQLEFILTVYSLGDGTGRLTNPILDSATSRYIITIQTNPNETNCMARALVVGLAVNQLLGKFKNKLTEKN